VYGFESAPIHPRFTTIISSLTRYSRKRRTLPLLHFQFLPRHLMLKTSWPRSRGMFEYPTGSSPGLPLALQIRKTHASNLVRSRLGSHSAWSSALRQILKYPLLTMGLPVRPFSGGRGGLNWATRRASLEALAHLSSSHRLLNHQQGSGLPLRRT